MTNFSIFLVICGFIGWDYYFGGFTPEPYRSRLCQGRAWKQAFPEKSKHEIRDYLHTVTDSFAFRKSQKLQINPNDGIRALYQTIYPPNTLKADAMELEAFTDELQKKYRIDLHTIWSDELTFGGLYEYCSCSIVNQI